MEDLSKAASAALVGVKEAFFTERGNFKKLLLTNPNYFGNLDEKFGKPVLKISASSFYEELGCVGYHLQQEMLEAVVYVKQQAGYGSDICGPGTSEYVRFYLSTDNGVTWQDQGLTSFQAYNVPGSATGNQRLEYAASLKVDPARKLCFLGSHLIQVRAILSWNNPPPANAPGWVPIWGGVRTAAIQVEPRRFFFPHDIFEIAKIKAVPQLTDLLDAHQPIKTVQKSLSVPELATLYKGTDVPQHRFAFKELAHFAKSKTTLSAENIIAAIPGLKLDPSIIDILFPKTDGNTSFEELTCIGLDPNLPDTLVGIVEVKKSSGYSGGPCTNGSQEYVSFWADFDGNGSFESFIGTGSVRVYDLPGIPSGGVHYAVRVPIDLEQHRQACKKGAKTVRIRAILSWNVPVTNADEVPTWGNREQTTILIAPKSGAPAGKIAILGGIAVSNIDSTTGLTKSGAVYAMNNILVSASPYGCAFGGRVTVIGLPINGYSYAVEVKPHNSSSWTRVVNDLIVTDQNGDTFPTIPKHVAQPDGRFLYLPYANNILGLLAQWDTTGVDLWDVKLTTYDPAVTVAGVDIHRIQVYNQAPDAAIEITVGSGDCGRFAIGDTLLGDFVARDVATFPFGTVDMLENYTITVEPAINVAPVGVPSPTGGTSSTSSAPGDGWSLPTAGMRPCGYVIRVVATNRTILNSASLGWQASDSSGFCLLQPD